MKLFWLIGRMVDWLCISGRHRAAFFALGRGGAEETVVRWDKAGQGAKSSGRSRATVKLGEFSGWGGAGQQLNSGHFRGGVRLKNFQGWAVWDRHFPQGRGGGHP